MPDTLAACRYAASVTVFRRYLERLGHLVDIAEAGGDPDVLTATLTPGMLPFAVQVEVAANFTLRAAFPLAGRPVPRLASEPTFDGLRQRIARTGELLDDLDPAAFAHPASITDQAGQAAVTLPPDRFLFEYALPNFFFHVGAAYHVLRHRGLPVGKADFDGFHVYG